jgi:N-acetylglucosaminyldiphosphoundecaprenol N-acetyl-beta-D-mannosaminyltransferase
MSSRIAVGAIAYDPVTTAEAAAMVRGGLDRGNGGCLVVLDDAMRRRADLDPAQADRWSQASVVLNGSPRLAWTSRLARRGQLRRCDAVQLVGTLCVAAASDRRRIFVLGGAPGRPGVPGGAQRAAAVLGLRYRGLRVAGCASPVPSTDPIELAAVAGELLATKPDLVLVGADVDTSAWLVATLRAELPGAWLIEVPGLVERIVGQDHPMWNPPVRSLVHALIAKDSASGPRPALRTESKAPRRASIMD